MSYAGGIKETAFVGGNHISTPDQIEDWRRDLKGKITWVLVLKLLGLILLWLLFFRRQG
jgi:hypothetical protein